MDVAFLMSSWIWKFPLNSTFDHFCKALTFFIKETLVWYFYFSEGNFLSRENFNDIFEAKGVNSLNFLAPFSNLRAEVLRSSWKSSIIYKTSERQPHKNLENWCSTRTIFYGSKIHFVKYGYAYDYKENFGSKVYSNASTMTFWVKKGFTDRKWINLPRNKFLDRERLFMIKNS